MMAQPEHTYKHTYGKDQRLKSVIVLDRAFTEGKKIKAFPILARYTDTSFESNHPYQVATTVSKRKRLMREAWRLEKHRLEEVWSEEESQRALVLIYVGKEIPSFEDCSHNIRKIIDVLLEK